MQAMAALAGLAWIAVQTTAPPVREALSSGRPLTPAEVAAALAAVHGTLQGKTFRLVSTKGADGPEVLMGGGGQPRTIRFTFRVGGGISRGVTADGARVPVEPSRASDAFVESEITDYVGAARRCDGAPADGEMVVRYSRRGGGSAWTASVHPRAPHDLGGPALASMFELLRGATAATGGDRRQIDGRPARALVADWTPSADLQTAPPRAIGDPLPNVPVAALPGPATQRLWIDVDSWLPLEWEVDFGGGIATSFRFVYVPLEVGPPAGVTAPACLR